MTESDASSRSETAESSPCTGNLIPPKFALTAVALTSLGVWESESALGFSFALSPKRRCCVTTACGTPSTLHYLHSAVAL